MINATGLAIGMSVSLLLITMLTYLYTFDNFHANQANIYRIITFYRDQDHELNLASAPSILVEHLDFAGIEKATRINTGFSGDVNSEGLNVPIRGYYTDPEFLSIFSFPLVQGNAHEALTKPNSIVITQSTAKKLFGHDNVLGNTIEIAKQGSFEVTGVMKDLPGNTHLVFECLVSYSTIPRPNTVIQYANPFSYGHEYIYFLVKPDTPLDQLNAPLDKLSEEVSRRSGVKVKYGWQALKDITPGKNLSMIGGLGSEWDLNSFYAFGAVCLLILIPACFNYANISIARAIKRSKEIGLRKTMGGQRSQIFFQFITETVLISIVSLSGAFVLFLIVRDEFQSTLVEAASLDFSLTWRSAGVFVLFAIVTGLAAGAAPAFYFARLSPVQALKNQATLKAFSGIGIRKVLAVFQFMLSFGFIVAMIVYSRQYRYSVNYDFGFQQKNILDVQLHGVDATVVTSEFSKLSSVHSISFSSDVLGLHSSTGDSWMQYENRRDSFKVNEMFVDQSYIDNLGLKLIAGTNFPANAWNHEQYIIVNEEFLKAFDIPGTSEALGKIVTVDRQELQILGVVKNFHYSSLRDPIGSFAFRMNPTRYQYANLKVSFTDAFGGIAEMEKQWKRIGNQTTFKGSFLNDEINTAYAFYNKVLKIFGFLGLLAISISLLGLLGMVIYTSETRTREVGIRKVFGASVIGVVYLLSKDYLKLMGWAFVIGTPLTIIIVDRMLESTQAYRVRLNVLDIITGMSVLIVLGVLTISSQTVKIANTNPSVTLKEH